MKGEQERQGQEYGARWEEEEDWAVRSPRGESESTSAKEKNEKGDVPTAGTGTERRGQGGPEQGPQARSGASREGKDETKSSGRGCSWEETGRVECGVLGWLSR